MQSNNISGHSLQWSLLTLALLTAPWALAQDNTPAWYGGASVGPTQATIANDQIVQRMREGGFPNAVVSDDGRDNGYKVFGGYQFNPNFALEGSYFDLGKFGFTARSSPADALNGELRLRGVGLDAVLMAPLTRKFSVFGKAGAHYSEARDNFASTGAVVVRDPNPSKSELNPKVGIGMQYAFSDALAVRAELERYRINDAVGSRGDIDHVSIGLVYSWGHARKPAPVVAAPPVPVVAMAPQPVAAPPEPLPAPPIVAPVPTKVTLSADSLFAFDKSAVSQEGKPELDAFASRLKTLDYEFVTVTGHTDRIGEQGYNQKLSTRRAEAVSAYLVQTGGIPSDKILARGQSGANPVTTPEECKGTKATPALIACLQPDRRVDLEVTGNEPPR